MSNEIITMPGVAPEKRVQDVIFLDDTSISMKDKFKEGYSKIDVLNQITPKVFDAIAKDAAAHTNADVRVSVIEFNSSARVVMNRVPIEKASSMWRDLECEGCTNLGAALEVLNDILSEGNGGRCLPPLIALITDGNTNVDHRKAMERLLENPYFRKAVKPAIALDCEVDNKTLLEFTGDKELVFTANNATEMVLLIRYASTLIDVRNKGRFEFNNLSTTDIGEDDTVLLSEEETETPIVNVIAEPVSDSNLFEGEDIF